jgi:WS/DGAT/MGAT family acyltransferase
MTDRQRDLKEIGAEWGGERQLTPFEHLMFRTEVNPMLRSTGIVLCVLDSAPDRDRVAAAHEWASRLLAPLRHRVVEDPTGLTGPRWVVDQDFDLDYHLRFVRLPDPGAISQVRDIAQVLAMSPFDRVRPLWEGVLVDGLADGRAAYLLKIHHSIADGEGTVQMFDILTSDQATAGRATPLPVPAPERTSGASLAAQALLGAPRRAIGEAIGLGRRMSGTAVHVAAHPDAVLGGVRYAQSLWRMLGGPPAPASPLLGQRSLGRRFGMIEVPLDDLRAAAKAAGGTVNDAFLAGLVGGMRGYHERHGIDIRELTLSFPISLRKPDDPPGANRFAGARIAVPVYERDPRVRIEFIGARTREARAEPALNFMDVMSPVLTRLPATMTGKLTERVTKSIDLQASNVRGLNRDAYLAGARVERMWAFGAAPGPATMATLISHNGTCCIAITLNSAAVPDADVFVECMEAGLAEVLTLAPRRRRSRAPEESPA